MRSFRFQSFFGPAQKAASPRKSCIAIAEKKKKKKKSRCKIESMSSSLFGISTTVMTWLKNAREI